MMCRFTGPVRREPGAPGFTLIETLIAISITAVIVVILFTALRMAYRAEERGLSAQDIDTHVRVLSDRLSWLLHGAYPYVVREEDKERIVFEGGSGELTFVTASADPYSGTLADRVGLKLVSLSLTEKGFGARERLFFLNGEDDDKADEELVLDAAVTRLAFFYLDAGDPEGAKPEAGAEWVESWDGAEKPYLPAAVKAEITIREGGRDVVLPAVLARIMTGERTLGAADKPPSSEP
jgi:prepilin-type N-terminal cleavage/methylation domain-containing protein